MNEKLKKAKNIFKSPALKAIKEWSRPVRGAILLISCIGVVNSLLSLGVTLVTKSLIDGATSGRSGALWIFGASLVALIAAERLLNIWSSSLNLKASATLQKHMQSLVTEAVLGKQYAALKGFHSGELVNRIFSDVSVVKSGVLSMLPMMLRIAVSFIGAAAILISMDWRFIPF